MQPPIQAQRSVGVVVSLGIALTVVGCAAPAASLTPEPTATISSAPSPVTAASIIATPVVTPPASATPAGSTPAASAAAGMLPSTTIPATTAPTGAIQLEMSGPPPLFRPTNLTGTAGEEVTFYLVNNSPAREEHGVHTLAIGRKLGEPLVVSAELKGGARAIFTVKGLLPGKYVIWCSLFGHAGLGQVGTLTLD